MWTKLVFGIGKRTAGFPLFAAFFLVVMGYDMWYPHFWTLLVIFFLSVLAGVVVHELGHLVAARALGAPVTAFRLGHDRFALRFHVGTVLVSLGFPDRGRVEIDRTRLSLGRWVTIAAAGPLVNLLPGVAVLAVLGLRTSPVAVVAALAFVGLGLTNLLPYRARSGRLNDGGRLLTLPAELRVAEAAKAMKAATRLSRAGRADELIALHAGLALPARRMSKAEVSARILVELRVSLLVGLPREQAVLAERHISVLMRECEPGEMWHLACLTLAVVRLRLGGPDDLAEAERLAAQLFGALDRGEDMRATVLAVVILSRQARGLPYQDVRAAAASDGIRPMPLAAELKATIDPERFLGAFRAGVPGTRAGAGVLALMLRRQGRIDELLELHRTFGEPEGNYLAEQVAALHAIEYYLLTLSDLPDEVTEEAAGRVELVLASYPFGTEGYDLPRPAAEHTLALARFRQGRFAEVEPLCKSGLADDVEPDARATVLATVALARRALGQPHADLVAEAVALDPKADLVAEAVLAAKAAAEGVVTRA